MDCCNGVKRIRINITDFKVTKNNPYSTYPFCPIYKTTSTEFIDWYSSLHDSASKFDEDNIHSLYNNLPEYFRENEQDNLDLKTFINMQGEHFDLIRNYIDNYSSFYSRKYNIKPIIINHYNMLDELKNLNSNFININFFKFNYF